MIKSAQLQQAYQKVPITFHAMDALSEAAKEISKTIKI